MERTSERIGWGARRGITVVALSVAAVAIGACAGSKLVAAKRTVMVRQGKVIQGRKLFRQYCSGCHGVKGEGKVGTAPQLRSPSFLAAASDTFLIETIKNGRPGTTMIPWGSTLSDDQIEAIVAFLRSLNPVPPAKLDESPLRGDPARGAKLYASICARCHGRHGLGYQEAGSGTAIGSSAFLKVASNGFLRYIIRNGKVGTPMKAFRDGEPAAVADLSDQEIEDVIAYLRQLGTQQ